MVRTTEQFPPPTISPRIVGGFVSIPVGHILAVWFACQGLELGVGEFRAWIAAIEMVKRRTFARDGTQLTYGYAELAGLLDVTHQRARLLVQNLVAAGLLTWSETAITFPAPPPLPDDLLGPFADTIGRGKGDLVVPRTLLRFLARGATTAIIAIALAALFRCLSCRKGQPDGWGRLKTAWIARAFRVGQRQVVAARNQLVELGWLIVEGDNRQWAMNRWGRAYRINLGWKPPTRPIARSAPPPPATAARSAPPLTDRNPLREEEIQNQNPASGGTAGVQLSEGEGQTEIPEIANPAAAAQSMILPAPPAPVVPLSPAPAQSQTRATTPTIPATGSPAVSSRARPVATPGTSSAVLGPVPAPGGLPAPRLADIRIEDLKDTARLLDLLGQAIARKLVGGSERDRLNFVALAEHALAIGKGNPPGLFAYLFRGGCWRYITQEDEDRAQARLKVHERGPEAVPACGRSAPTGVPGRVSSLVANEPRGDRPSSLSGMLVRRGLMGMVGDGGALGVGVAATSQESGPEPMVEGSAPKPAVEKPTSLNWRDYLLAEESAAPPMAKESAAKPMVELSPPKPMAEESAPKPAAEKPTSLNWRDYLPRVLGGGA